MRTLCPSCLQWTLGRWRGWNWEAQSLMSFSSLGQGLRLDRRGSKRKSLEALRPCVKGNWMPGWCSTVQPPTCLSSALSQKAFGGLSMPSGGLWTEPRKVAGSLSLDTREWPSQPTLVFTLKGRPSHAGFMQCHWELRWAKGSGGHRSGPNPINHNIRDQVDGDIATETRRAGEGTRSCADGSRVQDAVLVRNKEIWKKPSHSKEPDLTPKNFLNNWTELDFFFFF